MAGMGVDSRCRGRRHSCQCRRRRTAATLPSAVAAAPAAEPAPIPPVKVNRTAPRVSPPSLQPVFSDTPTENEIFRARVFGEPLVALGTTSGEENRALATALSAYLQRRRPEDTEAVESFPREHSSSPWRASLLMNLGVVWKRSNFTSAQKAFLPSGPIALGRILTRLRPGSPRSPKIEAFHAIADGASLPEMAALAQRAGLSMLECR